MITKNKTNFLQNEATFAATFCKERGFAIK